MTSEELFYNKKPGFDRTGWEKASEYAEGYKTFLDMGKTERDAVTAMIELAQEAGFAPYRRGMALQAHAAVGKGELVVGAKEQRPAQLGFQRRDALPQCLP